MSPAEIVGSIAAIMTTSAFLPQAVKVIKHKDTAAISLIMYLVFNIGVVLWFVYGIYTDSIPIIIGNLITFLFSFVILYYKATEKSRVRKNNLQ